MCASIDIIVELAILVQSLTILRHNSMASAWRMCSSLADEIQKRILASPSTDSPQSYDSTIFYGRALTAIIGLAPALRDLLDAPSGGAPLAKSCTWEALNTRISTILASSYDGWRAAVAAQFKRDIASYLADTAYWSHVTEMHRLLANSAQRASGGTWEQTTLSTEQPQSGAAEDAPPPLSPQTAWLPAHPSAALVNALSTVYAEVQRQGGYTLDRRRIIHPLVVACLLAALDAFMESAIDNAKVALQLQDTAPALQVHLDFGILWRMLCAGARSTDTAIFERHSRIADTLKARIDPVDFILFEAALDASAQRAVLKFAVVFDALVHGAAGGADGDNNTTGARQQHQQASTATTRFVQEHHNLVLMCPMPPRFALLPVAYVPPSGRKEQLPGRGSISSSTSVRLPATTMRERPPPPSSSSSRAKAVDTTSTLVANVTSISSSLQSKLGGFFSSFE